MIHKAVVVIPVHSEFPSPDELLALDQCYKVLSKYHVVVVHPEGLDLTQYLDVVPALATLPIDPMWQASLSNYNKLKCSYFFYEMFSSYEYLLTYELDAFVFRDELEEWCEKDYSYIGAPWFKGYANPVKPYEVTGIGNSGFSLRKISDCLAIMKRISKLRKIYRVYHKLRVNKLITFSSLIRKSRFSKFYQIKNYTYLPSLLNSYFVHEDVFWSVWVANTFSDFKLAPVSEALKFSFEVNPSFLFEKNNNNLPFGCHAWMKYEYDFWKDYIPIE